MSSLNFENAEAILWVIRAELSTASLEMLCPRKQNNHTFSIGKPFNETSELDSVTASGTLKDIVFVFLVDISTVGQIF